MKVELKKTECIVTREAGDPIPRGGGWGTAESRLYHWVKKELQRQGFDVIKRRMWKDGHMYGDETLQYIRERKHAFYIYDGNYAVRDIVEEYREKGRVTFLVQRNEEVKQAPTGTCEHGVTGQKLSMGSVVECAECCGDLQKKVDGFLDDAMFKADMEVLAERIDNDPEET